MGLRLGIDFGTCFSVAAVSQFGESISIPLDQVFLEPDFAYGYGYGIPSVFYHDSKHGSQVGIDAEKWGVGNNGVNLKRHIKMSINSSVTLGGQTFTGKQIAGYILSLVKSSALNALEKKGLSYPIEGVVISVPAGFGHNEKKSILEAAKMSVSEGGAGFNVLGLIKEPVAAAISYFESSMEDHTKILVYDLGGGTCDVAIVEADSSCPEKYKVIDSDMKRIGGRDWDSRIAQYVFRYIERKVKPEEIAEVMEAITKEANTAKHSLSVMQANGEYRNIAFIPISAYGEEIEITRKMFDDLTRDLFDETVKMVKELIKRNPEINISKFICVGGSSNMPQVKEGLKSAFPDFDIRIIAPEKAIALGASIYAKYCGSAMSILSDIAPFSYGVRVFENYKKNPNYLIIVNMIMKSDKLPKHTTHEFQTILDNQKEIVFPVYEANTKDLEYDYRENQKPIMEVRLDIEGLYPAETPLKCDMTLNSDGLIEVIAYDEHGHTVNVKEQLIF